MKYFNMDLSPEEMTEAVNSSNGQKMEDPPTCFQKSDSIMQLFKIHEVRQGPAVLSSSARQNI
jgi:hypothetical protein